MTYLMTILVLGICFAGMAVGLIIAKKSLRKGCSEDPSSCACRQQGKNPDDCDQN